MIKETLEELESSIAKAHDALKRELTKIRTGRANPAILDSIRVESYGSTMPLSQMATIGVPEARMLTVRPWDKSQIKIIEKAIVTSSLGLTPQNDGEMIRVPMPPLTEERRKEFVKIAKRAGEDVKVAIRKSRHEAKDMLDALKDDSDVSADEIERTLKKVEEIIQKGNADVDAMIARKEKDILEV
jgi:ribosome recycling factor